MDLSGFPHLTLACGVRDISGSWFPTFAAPSLLRPISPLLPSAAVDFVVPPPFNCTHVQLQSTPVIASSTTPLPLSPTAATKRKHIVTTSDATTATSRLPSISHGQGLGYLLLRQKSAATGPMRTKKSSSCRPTPPPPSLAPATDGTPTVTFIDLGAHNVLGDSTGVYEFSPYTPNCVKFDASRLDA